MKVSTPAARFVYLQANVRERINCIPSAFCHLQLKYYKTTSSTAFPLKKDYSK